LYKERKEIKNSQRKIEIYSKKRKENFWKNLIVLNASFRIDPTRTLTLRSQFVRDMKRRFKRIQKLIKIAIIDQDCFGLLSRNVISAFGAPTGKKQFDFPTTDDKVQSFMDWLKAQQSIQDEYGEPILNVTEEEGRKIVGKKPWTNLYIESAYKKGILRAQVEMSKKNVLGVKRDLNVAFFSPIHADRVGLIYTRTYNDLKSVTSLMNTEIERKVAEGLSTGLAKGIAEGKSPQLIAKELVQDVNNRVSAIGIHRAKLIARTEVIRAHHVAAINEYREAGMEGVEVMAEFEATNDLGVCERCLELEKRSKKKPYTLNEIEGMIPVHPQCRCVAITVPKIVEKEKKKMKRISPVIPKKIKQSFGKDLREGEDKLGTIAVFSANKERKRDQLQFLEELKNKVRSDDIQRLSYTKRGIEQIGEGWAGSIQFDNKGNPIGSVTFEIINDSLRIELLGSVSKGSGSTLIREMISESNKAGRGGAITLMPIRDINTIMFYDKCGFDFKPESPYGEFFMSSERAKIFSDVFDSKYGGIKINVQQDLDLERAKVLDALEDDFDGKVIVLAGSIND